MSFVVDLLLAAYGERRIFTPEEARRACPIAIPVYLWTNPRNATHYVAGHNGNFWLLPCPKPITIKRRAKVVDLAFPLNHFAPKDDDKPRPGQVIYGPW